MNRCAMATPQDVATFWGELLIPFAEQPAGEGRHVILLKDRATYCIS